jgi:hypothetical protein
MTGRSHAAAARVTRHYRFRLMNVVFSDTFVSRMGKADKAPSNSALDGGAVNENSGYQDLQHYNSFAKEAETSRFDGIVPALAVRHSNGKLRLMWKDILRRYDISLVQVEDDRLQWSLLELLRGGHTDSLCMEHWLSIREDRRETVMGLIVERARMSTLEDLREQTSARSGEASSSGQGPATRRRRLTTAERILEIVEKDRKDDVAERIERDAMKEGKSFDGVIRASVADQAAMGVVGGLNAKLASEIQDATAEAVLNKLVTAWANAAEKVTEQKQARFGEALTS